MEVLDRPEGRDQAAVELVRELFSIAFEQWPGPAYELLAEDYVAQTFTGHVFYGHIGYAQWFLDQARHFSDRRIRFSEIRSLGDGDVLVVGQVELVCRDGERQIQPGAWVTRVRDGRAVSTMFFEMTDEALRAVS
jgi:ketosteroid isomerase-like protein